MRIVWHGNYLKYFEIARCALLDEVGYNYDQMGASGYAWPVIDAKVRFGKPARFGDELKVTAAIREYEHRLRISYEIRNQQNQRLTRGSTVQVAVDLATNEMCYRSPDVLLQRLGVAPSAGEVSDA